MAFELRAMENIATAPASRAERLLSAWVDASAIVLFALVLPFASVRLAAVPAFVPSVVGATVLAQGLTSLLFFVQYRVARSSQLALLSIGYFASAYLTLFYVLTFPGVFSPSGLFHANAQTAAWATGFEHLGFGLFLIAFSVADRYHVRVPRNTVRLGALVTVLALGALSVALVQGRPEIATGTPDAVIVLFEPLLIAVYAAALIGLATLRLRTVTQVWLLTVALLRTIELVSLSPLAGGRYTPFWYAGRGLLFVASFVMLAVFVGKLNDLLLRLATRNRALHARTELAESELAEGELRYRTLANAVPQLIWATNAQGTVDYVNDRWVVYTGLDLEETAALGWRGALDETQPTSLHEAWHESLRDGSAFSGEYRLRDRSGRWRWFLVTAIPVRDPQGTITRWIGSCTDIDQQKRIEEREVFLAGAGDRLSASLDMHATLDTIAQLVVGRMAAWVRVDLLDDEGRFSPMLFASSSSEEEAVLRELLGHPVAEPLEALFTTALARREPLVERERVDIAGGQPGVRVGRLIIVPLTSGETFLGTLSLVHDDPRPPEPDEIAMARDFGRRASQALDHARLYERERSTADALQRAMLPQAMPQVENVAFSASYSAASESQRVGGDFYDAFTLPDGRVALTIGDVTGHGLQAAVIMGEIRQALRAASYERAEPSTILDRASHLLVASGRSVFVTAVFGVLDTATGRFEYATAGHPSPLVFDGTALVRLATAGLPIGLRDGEGVDFALTLPPQSTLVLYTDGLLEFSRDLDEGERRIEAAIRELGDDDIGHLAGAIMKRVLRDDEATDDIAILTATLGDLPARPPHDVREWRFHSTDARTATLVRHEVGALVAAGTRRANATYESELVFGELFSNVVRHAPGPVVVRVAGLDDGVDVTVADRGPGFAGWTLPSDGLAESGRGLALVRALADDVIIDAEPPGARISVRFYTATAASSAGANAARRSA